MLKNWLLRQTYHQSCPPLSSDRILIISTTALGDTLWATPAIANLRMHFPKAKIAVLTSKIGYSLLQHHPQIDQLYLLKEPVLLHLFPLIKKIKAEHFDTAFIFHSSQRLILPLCHLAHIPRIIATRGINKGLDDLITHPVEPVFQHEVERRFNLISQQHVPIRIRTLSYYVQKNERMDADRFIGPTQKKLIAIHPGSKEAFRRWPPQCFAWIAKELQKNLDCEIFLTGSPYEISILKNIQDEVPSARIVPFSSIRFLGALFERMDLVLSNDTGPLHLAAALNRPAVGIYVSTDPRLCGPYFAPLSSVVAASPTCKPCIKRRCKDPFCFMQIDPVKVLKQCEICVSQKY